MLKYHLPLITMEMRENANILVSVISVHNKLSLFLIWRFHVFYQKL